jgi:hypothetical protein
MKKIIFLIIISTTFLFSQDSTKYTQDSVKYNGRWWKMVGSLDQIPYLTGLFDGLSLGATVILNEFRPNDICYQTGASAADDFFTKLDTIRVGNMYEELEKFYGDSANLNVKFDNAFRYIVYRLSGYEETKLRKMLELYRKDENLK